VPKCLRPFALAPAPILHCRDGGGARIEEHQALVHGGTAPAARGRQGPCRNDTGSYCSHSRWRRSCTTCLLRVPRFRPGWHSAARSPTIRTRAGPDLTLQEQRRRADQGAPCPGTRRDSTCLLKVPRFTPEGHSAEIYPTARVHAGADLALQRHRRRAGRGAQCRGTALVPDVVAGIWTGRGPGLPR